MHPRDNKLSTDMQQLIFYLSMYDSPWEREIILTSKV